MQIRRRLTIQFILIVAIIMVFALMFIHFEFEEQVRDDFYSNLKSKAIMTADMIVGHEVLYNEKKNETNPNLSIYTENITIYNQDNKRIYSFNPGSEFLDAGKLSEIKSSGEYRFNREAFNALGLVYRDKSNNNYVVVAEAVFKSEHLNDLTKILMLVFILFIVLVAIGGWIFAGQALAPVNHIMNELEEILPTDMSHRLKIHNQNDELSRLVITFNNLLDRIQKAFVTQKLFLSNISHELKNPLSVIISQIEVSLQNERTPQQYKETLNSILDDTKNLNEVSNKLMQLARITADHTVVEFNEFRIDELVWQVKSQLVKAHPEYKIHFEIFNLPEDERNLVVNANEALIKTALVNLMENGCKFSPDYKIKVLMDCQLNQQIQIDIEDNGPGINEADLPYIFEPFYRSPQTSVIKGSGIGLSLVSSILKIHKIRMDVFPGVSGGTVFRLMFTPIAIQQTELTSKPIALQSKTQFELQYH